MDEQTKSSSEIENIFGSLNWRLSRVGYQIAGFGACNISFVPEEIRKWNVEAYIPQVVSIGPLHKGTRNNLLFMEEIKWRCLYYLLSRAEEPETKFKTCIEYVLDWDQMVRTIYNVVEIKFNCEELAKVMLLDICFLVELVFSGSPELNDLYKSRLDYTSPGVQVIKREKVLSDLTMLENQIPLHPFEILFSNFYHKSGSYDGGLINKHVLSMFGYRHAGSTSSLLKLKNSHFLELIHSFIDKEKYEHVGEENNQVIISVGTTAEQVNISHGKQKLQRCATRLQAAGVAVEPSECAENRFDLRVKFSNGKLQIPQLHITQTTEAKWRNFIAYEVTNILAEYDGRRALGRRGFLELMGNGDNTEIMSDDDDTGINCQFICYAWFFQSLICCVHDVKLLRERQIIFVHEDKESRKKAMRDEDLMNLFHKLTKGISECDAEIPMDPYIGDVIRRLNSYTHPSVHCSTETGKIMWHVLRRVLSWIWYSCRDSYQVLIRDYIPSGWRLVAVLAAAAGLVLTAIQTVFSAPRGH